jgi:hypothetical protein
MSKIRYLGGGWSGIRTLGMAQQQSPDNPQFAELSWARARLPKIEFWRVYPVPGKYRRADVPQERLSKTEI